MCPYFVFCDVISLSGKKSDLKIENLENLRKTFCIGKKSDFNFQKVGFFGRKKGSPILLKTFSDEVQVV